MLTFCDILLSTTGQCINPLNLVRVFVRRHISPQPHPRQHEHDTVTPVLYPNPMWLCTGANSEIDVKCIQNRLFTQNIQEQIVKTYVFANNCNAHSHYSWFSISFLFSFGSIWLILTSKWTENLFRHKPQWQHINRKQFIVIATLTHTPLAAHNCQRSSGELSMSNSSSYSTKIKTTANIQCTLKSNETKSMTFDRLFFS